MKRIAVIAGVIAATLITASQASAGVYAQTCYRLDPGQTRTALSGTQNVKVWEWSPNGPATGLSYGSGYVLYWVLKDTRRVYYREWHANYGWTNQIIRWYPNGGPSYPSRRYVWHANGAIPVHVCEYL